MSKTNWLSPLRAGCLLRMPSGEVLVAACELGIVCVLSGKPFVDENDLARIVEHVKAETARRRVAIELLPPAPFNPFLPNPTR